MIPDFFGDITQFFVIAFQMVKDDLLRVHCFSSRRGRLLQHQHSAYDFDLEVSKSTLEVAACVDDIAAKSIAGATNLVARCRCDL